MASATGVCIGDMSPARRRQLGYGRIADFRTADARGPGRASSDSLLPGPGHGIACEAGRGDLGCGAVSVLLRREGQAIVWDEMGSQNNYEEGWHPIEGLGPYSFDFEQYRAAIKNATLLEHPRA